MFRFFRILMAASILGIIALTLACASAGKQPAVTTPEKKFVAPSDLKAESSNARLLLSWKTNRISSVLISGYNIYLASQPVISENNPEQLKAGISPFNGTPYPGDDDPETAYETFTAEGLENGLTYYAAVTTVFPDGSESAPSNMIGAACYPRGKVTIKDRDIGEPHGFSFKLGESVAYNSLENDLYFIARDIGNLLGSPDRNEGVLNHTEFAELSGVRMLDDRHDYKNLPYQDRTFVAEGKVYMIKLSDGSLAKILVRQVDSSAYKRQVIFDYIYFGR